MRIGRFSFRQRWIDREVSPSLTAVAVLLIALGGFRLGFVAGRWMDRVSFSLPCELGVGGLGIGEGKIGFVGVPLPGATISVPDSVFTALGIRSLV